MKKLAIILASMAMAGCSATSLRCGVSDEDSYVELINVPQDISSQARFFTSLCGFSYEQDREPVARLNIIDQAGQ